MSMYPANVRRIPTTEPRPQHHCQRCGRDWGGIIDGRPKQCPTCHSPQWDQPRKYRRPRPEAATA